MIAACQNCDWTGHVAIVGAHIPHLSERVLPGEVMPLGECPECGALCHPQSPPPTLDLDAIQLRLVSVNFTFHVGEEDDDPDTLGKHWWTWTGPGGRWDVECGPSFDTVEEAVVSALDALIDYSIHDAKGI